MKSESLRRFEIDGRAERGTALLRGLAAIAVTAGAIAILASDPGTIGWVVALAGLGVSLGWIFAFRRGRKRARTPEDHFLELGGSDLTLADGRRRHQIPWSEVCGVRVDENRLVVLVQRNNEETLAVEPRYRGVGIYELAEAIRGAWTDATDKGVIK